MISLNKSLLFAILLSVGCGAQNRAHVMPNSSPDAGTSMEKTGNGGFADEEAYRVIAAASKRASKAIANFTNENVLKTYFKLKFGAVPPNFSQKLLADILGDIHLAPKEQKFRDGRELMFDYNDDGKVPYIVALKPFFSAFSNWKSGTIPDGLVDSASRKLMHEGAHIFGLNENQSQEFADGIFSLLSYDLIACKGNPYGASWNLNSSQLADPFSDFSDFSSEPPEKLQLFVTNIAFKDSKKDKTWSAWNASAWDSPLRTRNTRFTEPFNGQRIVGQADQYVEKKQLEGAEFDVTMAENFLDGEGFITSDAYAVKKSNLYGCAHQGLKNALEEKKDNWGWGQ